MSSFSAFNFILVVHTMADVLFAVLNMDILISIMTIITFKNFNATIRHGRNISTSWQVDDWGRWKSGMYSTEWWHMVTQPQLSTLCSCFFFVCFLTIRTTLAVTDNAWKFCMSKNWSWTPVKWSSDRNCRASALRNLHGMKYSLRQNQQQNPD